MTVITEQPASRKPGGAQQKRANTTGAPALEPVIQSAFGIVRESAGLLYHIAAFGIALVSAPKISRPKCDSEQPRPAAPKGANVILFPDPKRRATRQSSNRNRS
jgi:hypothetical protein